MITKEDMDALNKFISLYPTWWYKIGWCDLTRDFDCAPQGHSPEFQFIENGFWPDDCFSCDSTGSLADAIEQVMCDIEKAKKMRHPDDEPFENTCCCGHDMSKGTCGGAYACCKSEAQWFRELKARKEGQNNGYL